MAAADRLSVLPDDVLLRILSFAPAWEAAASSLLSRRWRSLWRRTSVLNLDSKPYAQAERDYSYSTPTCDAFFYHADVILAAFRQRHNGTGLKGLTFFLEQGTYYRSQSSYSSNAEQKEDRRVAVLVQDPAVARLEELSIGCEQSYSREYYYSPPLSSLPCASTLRVLELTHCNLEPPSLTPGLVFPGLVDLRLRGCFVLDGHLQVMVDAAPILASLALVNVRLWAPEGKRIGMSECFKLPLRLRCPTVTALLVLLSYVEEEEIKASANDGRGVELDMPGLRTFRYRGYPVKLSLTSPAPGLARVDLDVSKRHQNAWALKYEPLTRMLKSLSSTRALKLHLHCFENEISPGEEDDGAILPTFPNLKLLELDAEYWNMNSNTAAATARLLRSCPAMSELRLRIPLNRYDYEDDDIEGSFGESVEWFERIASMSVRHRTAVQLGGVSELPDALTNNCAFTCLQKNLRKVTLQFEAKEVNCFQVQLAKFLVENAMVLEEIHVDDGSQFWPDHLCNKLATWRADSFRRRNLPETAGFRVCQLQLDSPAVDSNDESAYESQSY